MEDLPGDECAGGEGMNASISHIGTSQGRELCRASTVGSRRVDSVPQKPFGRSTAGREIHCISLAEACV